MRREDSMMHNRRAFLKAAGLAIAGAGETLAQAGAGPSAKSVQTPALTIAYEESGSAQGFPIILLHGFPDDARAFDGAAPPPVNAGPRELVPHLRGYGRTRFRHASLPRMAATAATVLDVVDVPDALLLTL